MAVGEEEEGEGGIIPTSRNLPRPRASGPPPGRRDGVVSLPPLAEGLWEVLLATPVVVALWIVVRPARPPVVRCVALGGGPLLG